VERDVARRVLTPLPEDTRRVPPPRVTDPCPGKGQLCGSGKSQLCHLPEEQGRRDGKI